MTSFNWSPERKMPFRRQGRRSGAGFVCSEMVSCTGLHDGNERTLGYLRVVDVNIVLDFHISIYSGG
jgi:tRNA-dihydrouridine synthase